MGGNQPWVERYRPKTLSDVIGNQAAIDRMKMAARTGNLTNLILAGPPGTGKTSSLLAMANDMLGERLKDAFIELNASDERGIEVVRQDIKAFARRQVPLPPGRYKIILLDEADSMTDGAQQAMRRIMERESGTTRFVFSCNQSDKIIEPIQSRCAVVRFSRIAEADLVRRLAWICEQEKVGYVSDGLAALAVLCDGDVRMAINGLQATAVRHGFVDGQNVQQTIDAPNPAAVQEMVEACLRGDLRASIAIMASLQQRGHGPSDLLGSVFRCVRYNDRLPERSKLALLREVGLAQVALAQGMGSALQLNGLLARMFLSVRNQK